MADSAVGFLVGKLGELLSTKLDQIRGVDIKILSLSNKLALMRAFLKDMDARRRDNERIKVWVDQVRDITFRAEDAIDRYIYEVQSRRRAGFVGSTKNFVSHAGSLKVRYQLASEIEEIGKILQEITDSTSKFGIDLQQSQGGTSPTNSNQQWQQNRAFAADVEETEVIGFDEHITNLVKQLTNDKQEDVVVAIVGTVGLGKTTLASSIFKHAEIKSHFDCQAWVSVTQKYKRRDLLKSMLEDFSMSYKEKLKKNGKTEDEKSIPEDMPMPNTQKLMIHGKKEDEKSMPEDMPMPNNEMLKIHGKKEDEKSMLKDSLKAAKEKLKIPRGTEDKTEQLDTDDLEKMREIDIQKKLKGHLQGKRYLLVIDDIWDGEAWNCIRPALPNEKNGSGILLTTRNDHVAKCVRLSASLYNINTLDAADGWKLLCSKAFKANEGPSQKLEQLGMKMVSKCGGLPLSITMVGEILSRKPKQPREWSKVLNRISHELYERDNDKNVRSMFALSYDDLPHYLRPCFVYFGLFPEDSEIDVENLIQLWVAEGFIQARGEQTMEEVAEDYLGELVDRRMIQIVERNSRGDPVSCRIDHFLHVLSITQGKEDKFLSIIAGNPPANNVQQAASPRRVAVHGQRIFECMPTHRSSPSSLRSMLCYNSEATLSQVRLIVNNLKLLRVLDLKGVTIRRLPRQIGSMAHLRYLGLKSNRILRLPSSLGKLRNLQTLRVDGCWMPDAVWKIETLRHVMGPVLMKWRTIHCSCRGNLQTLWGINSGNWVGKALGDFTNLRALWIHNILATHVEGLSESLKKLTRLNKLTLQLIAAPTIVEKVLGALADHRELYELSFTGERAEKFPSATLLYTIAVIFACIAYPNLICTGFPCLFSSYVVAATQEWLPPQFDVKLKFPKSLTRLELGIPIFSKQEELKSLEKLPNLKILILDGNAYTGEEMVFSSDCFTKLEELQLSELKELEQLIIKHDGAMPSLKRLMINKCPMLKSLPEGLQHITTLQQ